jgi:hypothetical protein
LKALLRHHKLYANAGQLSASHMRWTENIEGWRYRLRAAKLHDLASIIGDPAYRLQD